MTMNEQLSVIVIIALLMVIVFIWRRSNRAKRAHEDHMAKLRRERKANLDALKQQAAQDAASPPTE